MRPMNSDSQGGRIVRAMVMTWPGYAGGPDEFGNDFHTARNRMGDTLKPRGLRTVGRRRKGHPWWEYRFADEVIYREAALLVRSWDTGEDIEMLRAADRRRTAADGDGSRGLQTSLQMG